MFIFFCSRFRCVVFLYINCRVYFLYLSLLAKTTFNRQDKQLVKAKSSKEIEMHVPFLATLLV